MTARETDDRQTDRQTDRHTDGLLYDSSDALSTYFIVFEIRRLIFWSRSPGIPGNLPFAKFPREFPGIFMNWHFLH